MLKTSFFSLFVFMLFISCAFSQDFDFYSPSDSNTGMCGVAGQVVSSRGPLAGARISLSSGASAVSDGSGEFFMDGIKPGAYGIEILKTGFKTAHGTVVAEPGRTKRILIKLSALNEHSAKTASGSGKQRHEEYTSMTIKVLPSRDLTGGPRNMGKLWYVSSIRVEALDGIGKWHETYDRPYDRSDAAKELYCRDAVLGKTYRIEIEWHTIRGNDSKTRYWHEKLENRDEVFHFDEPGGY